MGESDAFRNGEQHNLSRFGLRFGSLRRSGDVVSCPAARRRRSPPRALRSVAALLFAACAAGGAAQSDTTPTIATATRLVYVDVVVRDGHGQIVRGLRESDFRVAEDHREQRVAFFAAHQPSTPRSLSSLPASGAPGGPLQFSNIDATRGSDALTIVLFDLLDTAAPDQPYARTQMIDFLRKLPGGRQVALFVLADRLRMLQGFTGSSDLLVEAATALNPKEMNQVRNGAQKLTQSEDIAYVEQGVGHGPNATQLGRALLAEFAREDQINTKKQLEIVTQAFAEIAAATAGYPGRKNLLWLSASYPPAALNALSAPGSTFSLRANAEQAERSISGAQVAVYPISVLGVEVDALGAEQRGLGTSGDVPSGQVALQQFTDRQNTRQTMRVIAEQTGGRAIYGTNDLASALAGAMQDGETYYTLAYRPSNQSLSGGYRRITVSLPGRDDTLSYRRGYFAEGATHVPAAKPDAGRVLIGAMLPETPQFTTLALRAGVTLPAKPGAPVAVDSLLDARGLDLPVGADGLRHGSVQVLLVALAAGQKGAPPQSSGTLNLNLTPEQYRAVLGEGIHFHQDLKLGRGRYRLRLGAVNTVDTAIGTLDLPIEVP